MKRSFLKIVYMALMRTKSTALREESDLGSPITLSRRNGNK